MADSSSFRAAGTVVNPLSKAMGSMREVLEHHTGESGEQKLLKNMLQLFAIVLRADGAISMEQQSVATLVRDTYGEAASSKLQQMLTEDPPDLESVCAGLNVLSGEERKPCCALFIAAFAITALPGLRRGACTKSPVPWVSRRKLTWAAALEDTTAVAKISAQHWLDRFGGGDWHLRAHGHLPESRLVWPDPRLFFPAPPTAVSEQLS